MPYPRENLLQATNYPAANEAATAETPAPEANMRIRVVRVYAGYNAAPTGGVLTITDGTTSLKFFLGAAGSLPFEVEFQAAPGKAVKATLAAAGAAVTGALVMLYTID